MAGAPVIIPKTTVNPRFYVPVLTDRGRLWGLSSWSSLSEAREAVVRLRAEAAASPFSLWAVDAARLATHIIETGPTGHTSHPITCPIARDERA